MLLEVRNIRSYYGKAEALKGISLIAKEGEVVALIGSNGAGKTTTLRTISGLKQPSEGDIFFLGKKITNLAPHAIVAMGIAHVQEGRHVFNEMTVKENLEMGAYTRNSRIEIEIDLGRVYESFPILKERNRQRAGSLSGGEQQMLAMARALMARPTLLLLDEPSLGLSPLFVREIAKIIKNISALGVSIILIEQNARMALKLASRAYVLELGSIVIEGQADKLIADDQVKKAYLGCTAE